VGALAGVTASYATERGNILPLFGRVSESEGEGEGEGDGEVPRSYCRK
jgi:hypothetical protein